MEKYFYPYVDFPKGDCDCYDVCVLSNESIRDSRILLKFQEGILVCEEPLSRDAYLDRHEMEGFAREKRGEFIPFGRTLNLEGDVRGISLKKEQLVPNED